MWLKRGASVSKQDGFNSGVAFGVTEWQMVGGGEYSFAKGVL